MENETDHVLLGLEGSRRTAATRMEPGRHPVHLDRSSPPESAATDGEPWRSTQTEGRLEATADDPEGALDELLSEAHRARSEQAT